MKSIREWIDILNEGPIKIPGMSSDSGIVGIPARQIGDQPKSDYIKMDPVPDDYDPDQLNVSKTIPGEEPDNITLPEQHRIRIGDELYLFRVLFDYNQMPTLILVDTPIGRNDLLIQKTVKDGIKKYFKNKNSPYRMLPVHYTYGGYVRPKKKTLR